MELNGKSEFDGYVPYQEDNAISFDDYVPSQLVADAINEGRTQQMEHDVVQQYPLAGKAIEAGKEATDKTALENFVDEHWPLRWAKNIGSFGGAPEAMTEAALDVAAAVPYAAGKAFGRTVDYAAKGANLLLPGDPIEADWEQSFEEGLQETGLGRAIKRGGDKAPVFSDFAADIPAMLSLNAIGTGVASKALSGLGKLVMAEKSSNALVGLLSTKFAQYAPKMKDALRNSDFFKAVVNPKTVGAAALEGSWGTYLGSFTGALTRNIAGDVASSPTWYYKDRPGDENYQQKNGLIATNFWWNAVFSVGSPMFIAGKHAFNRIMQSAENTKEFRNVVNRLDAAGGHMTTPIKNKQVDTMRDFRTYMEFEREITAPIIAGTKTAKEQFQNSPLVTQESMMANILVGKIKKLFGWGADVNIDASYANKKRLAMSGKLTDEELAKQSFWEQLEDIFGTSISDMYHEIAIINPSATRIPADASKVYGKAKTLKGWLDNKLVETDGKTWTVTRSGQNAGLVMLNPTGKVSDLRIVKGMATRAPVSFEDIIGAKIATEKSVLNKSAATSFILGEVDDAGRLVNVTMPEFTGGISPSLAEVIKVLGAGDTKKVGSRGLFQSLSRAMRYNPEGKAIIELGKKANIVSLQLEKKAADRMPAWHKAMTGKNNEGFNEFFEVYSPLRNKGYEALDIVLDEADGNWKVILDPNSQHNIRKLTELYGEDKVEAMLEAARGSNPSPIYMPSMRDKNAVAAVANGTVGAELLVEWKNMQEQLYAAFLHSNKIYDMGRVYRKYHTQVVDEPGENLWRFYRKEGKTNELVGTFRTKQDAEKALEAFNEAHTVDGVPIVETTPVMRGAEGLQLSVKPGEDPRLLQTLRGRATEGSPRGRWQGDLYDQGFEAGVEIYQGVLAEVRGAFRENLRASYSKVLDSLNVTGREATSEYLDMMLGKPPKVEIVKKLDNAIDSIIDFTYNNTFRKWKEVKADDLYKASPVQLRNRGRTFFNNTAKNISLAMYSAGNLSAATVNMVSMIQNLPTAVEWYNKFPNETKEMWLLRTGLKTLGKEGAEFASDTAIGVSFLKNMTKPEYVNKLYKMAEETGVMTNELKELKFALDPVAKANQWKLTKLAEWSSGLVFKTEEWSRLAAFGTGYELAVKRFGLDDKFAKQFAANFVDVAMGGYNLFDRPGITNSLAMKHLTMFTTYTYNMFTRIFDMLEGGNISGAAKAQMLTAIMFGPKAVPGMKQWIQMHGLEDETSVSVLGDMGLSGYSGLVLNGMLDFDAVALTRGFQEPLLLSAIVDTKRMIGDIASSIAASGTIDMQYVMESINANFPAVMARRLAQFALGGKYTMNHSQLTAEKESIAEEILQRARLLSGFSSTQERLYGNMERFKDQKDVARQEAIKTIRMSMLAAERGDGTPEALFEKLFRIYGGDMKQASATFIDVLTKSKSSRQDRFLSEMLKKSKLDSTTEFLLNAMTKSSELQ